MIRRCGFTILLALAVVSCGKVRTPTESGTAGFSITASDFMFSPANITVPSGSAVTWRNGGGFHNVTADDGSFQCSNGCNDQDGNGAPSSNSWSFSRTLTTPGVFHFHCAVHGAAGGVGMSGTITVTPAP
jgi:plastocyanin